MTTFAEDLDRKAVTLREAHFGVTMECKIQYNQLGEIVTLDIPASTFHLVKEDDGPYKDRLDPEKKAFLEENTALIVRMVLHQALVNAMPKNEAEAAALAMKAGKAVDKRSNQG